MLSLKEKERRLASEERQWSRERHLLARESALKRDKERILRKYKKTTPTSKKLIWYLFLNCTIIEIIVIIVTFKTLSLTPYTGVMPDFTPLVTLVGTIVSEVIGYAVYAVKSAKENTAGGITYDMALRKMDAPPGEKAHPNENAVG